MDKEIYHSLVEFQDPSRSLRSSLACIVCERITFVYYTFYLALVVCGDRTWIESIPRPSPSLESLVRRLLTYTSASKLAPNVGYNNHSRLQEDDQALDQNHRRIPPINVLLPENLDRE